MEIMKRLKGFFIEAEPADMLLRLAPFFLLLVEIITLIDPEFWSRHLERRQAIDVLYVAWIVVAGYKDWDWGWTILFIGWSFVPDLLIPGHRNRYLSGTPEVLRVDAAVCAGFILYYVWRYEAIRYVDILWTAALRIGSRFAFAARPIFWVGKKIISGNITRLLGFWEKLDGDPNDFFIYQGALIANSLKIKSIWISENRISSGLEINLNYENRYIIIKVNSPVKAALAENVLSGKIPLESLKPYKYKQ